MHFIRNLLEFHNYNDHVFHNDLGSQRPRHATSSVFIYSRLKYIQLTIPDFLFFLAFKTYKNCKTCCQTQQYRLEISRPHLTCVCQQWKSVHRT